MADPIPLPEANGHIDAEQEDQSAQVASPKRVNKIRRVDYFPDEFLVGTTDLSLEESGAYWKVCSLIYSRGCAIDNDDRWLANAIAADIRKWKPIKARLVAKGKLVIVGDRLTNPRCEIELKKAHRRIDEARENGGKGGRPKGDPLGDLGEMSARSPGDVPRYVPTSLGDLAEISTNELHDNNDLEKAKGFRDRKPNQEPPTTNHQRKKNIHGRSPSVSSSGADVFDRFWSAYPSRGQAANPKKPAREKFLRLVERGQSADEIIRGAHGYASHCHSARIAGTNFVMQASRFLHQEVWRQYLGQANGNAEPWKMDPQAWRDTKSPPPWPDAPQGTHCGVWLKHSTGWVIG